MTVRKVVSSDGQIIDLDGVGYNPHNGGIMGEIKDHRDFLRIADIAYYCNEAKLVADVHGEYSILGDPTEAALLTMSEKIYKSFNDETTSAMYKSQFFLLILNVNVCR